MADTVRYLTPVEVAAEIDMTPDGVRKLIRRGEMKALRLSERKIVVSRAALEAYRRKVNGETITVAELPLPGDPDEMRRRFGELTGMSPAQWLGAWKRDELEDSAENMALMMQASALRSLELAEPGRRSGNGRGTTRARLRGEIHTVHRDGKWVNEVAGAKRASSSAPTKAEAVAKGREMARRRKTEHIVHKLDGSIGERNSYGNDPSRIPG